jgi:hypothetical protein
MQESSGTRVAVRVLDLIEQSAGIRIEWIVTSRFDFTKALFRKHADHRFAISSPSTALLTAELLRSTRSDGVAAASIRAVQDAESAGLNDKARAVGEMHRPLDAARIVGHVSAVLAVAKGRVERRVGTDGPVDATDVPERGKPQGNVRA